MRPSGNPPKWQKGTLTVAIRDARMVAMNSTKRKFIRWIELFGALPLTGAIALHGCSGQLIAPSSVAEVSTKSMSVGTADSASFSGAQSVKVFDNLARRPSGPYWGGVQVVIAGGNGSATFPDTQIAGAFTPSTSATATSVEVAAVCPGMYGYGCGGGFTLNVNQDNNGVPGAALITAQIPQFPPNIPLCCALIVGKIPSGLALQGGKQYWVVISGQNSQATDLAGWDENATDQLHPFLDAVYCAYASKCPSGPGWYPFQESIGFGTGLAFAVLGGRK
jgi:hypothetical protein